MRLVTKRLVDAASANQIVVAKISVVAITIGIFTSTITVAAVTS